MPSWPPLPAPYQLRPASAGRRVARRRRRVASSRISRGNSDLRTVAVRDQVQTGCVQSYRGGVRRGLTAMGFLLLVTADCTFGVLVLLALCTSGPTQATAKLTNGVSHR